MAVIVTYTNEYGDSIEFSRNSDIRITGIDGLSANSIELSEATVTNQVGSSITGASVQSKSMTIEGRYFYTPAVRKRLLAVILPGVSARLRYQNTKENIDVYWEGQPTKTPDISTNPCSQDSDSRRPTLQRCRGRFHPESSNLCRPSPIEVTSRQDSL